MMRPGTAVPARGHAGISEICGRCLRFGGRVLRTDRLARGLGRGSPAVARASERHRYMRVSWTVRLRQGSGGTAFAREMTGLAWPKLALASEGWSG